MNNIARRPKGLLAIAAVVASGLVLSAPPAHATTPRPACGSYMAGWNYWRGQFNNEFLRTNGVYTDYMGYAASKANDYLDLWNQYGCTYP